MHPNAHFGRPPTLLFVPEQPGFLCLIFRFAHGTCITRFLQVHQLLAQSGVPSISVAIANGGDTAVEQEHGREKQRCRKESDFSFHNK